MTERVAYDNQGGFRSGRRHVNQIISLKQLGEKARKKKKVYVAFTYIEKARGSANKEAL